MEVDLTQNRATMALWTLAVVDLFYYIMCEDPREHTTFIETTVEEGPVTYDFILHLRVRDYTT